MKILTILLVELIACDYILYFL